MIFSSFFPYKSKIFTKWSFYLSSFSVKIQLVFKNKFKKKRKIIICEKGIIVIKIKLLMKCYCWKRDDPCLKWLKLNICKLLNLEKVWTYETKKMFDKVVNNDNFYLKVVQKQFKVTFHE